MAYSTPQVVLASAARTTSGSAIVGLADTGASLDLLVNVSAASGTSPTLALTVDWSPDGVTFCTSEDTTDAFASITGVKNTTKRFTVKATYYRLNWTIGGTTPSFTFAISAYVTP